MHFDVVLENADYHKEKVDLDDVSCYHNILSSINHNAIFTQAVCYVSVSGVLPESF